jgi:hypothetical protein
LVSAVVDDRVVVFEEVARIAEVETVAGRRAGAVAAFATIIVVFEDEGLGVRVIDLLAELVVPGPDRLFQLRRIRLSA